jgi:hypothetical protein
VDEVEMTTNVHCIINIEVKRLNFYRNNLINDTYTYKEIIANHDQCESTLKNKKIRL